MLNVSAQSGGYTKTVCTQSDIDRELGVSSAELESTIRWGEGAVQSSTGASSWVAFLATGGVVIPPYPGHHKGLRQDNSPVYELFVTCEFQVSGTGPAPEIASNTNITCHHFIFGVLPPVLCAYPPSSSFPILSSTFISFFYSLEITSCLQVLSKGKNILLPREKLVRMLYILPPGSWLLQKQGGVGGEKEGLSPDRWVTFYGE